MKECKDGSKQISPAQVEEILNLHRTLVAAGEVRHDASVCIALWMQHISMSNLSTVYKKVVNNTLDILSTHLSGNHEEFGKEVNLLYLVGMHEYLCNQLDLDSCYKVFYQITYSTVRFYDEETSNILEATNFILEKWKEKHDMSNKLNNIKKQVADMMHQLDEVAEIVQLQETILSIDGSNLTLASCESLKQSLIVFMCWKLTNDFVHNSSLSGVA